MSAALVEHSFRHEYGKLVATLARRVGVQHIEAVEDAVQSALMRALESWPRTGEPERPSAWLFRVAHNILRDNLRNQLGRARLAARHAASLQPPPQPPVEALARELRDDLLRMLFVCCDDTIPAASQLVLALKTLCGFSVREIALRLFLSEANVYKRLGRARSRLRAASPHPLDLAAALSAERTAAVHKVLYLLFTEGYLSSHAELAIRRELCREALRLALALAEHPIGQTPASFALVALMHLHLARIGSRQDSCGALVLLEQQDRSAWDQAQIERGLSWLARSAQGEELSRYHAEAGIAAEHCLAATFAATRWDRIVTGYDLLQQLAPSPLHRLGRALALAEWRGPGVGLAAVKDYQPPTWLAGSYMWSAVLADLHRRAGDIEEAERYRRLAIASAPTAPLRQAIERRLGSADTDDASA